MVSIYEAEIRHKPWAKIVEDQLTSRVFGAIAMLPEDTVLIPFIRYLTDDVMLSGGKDAQVLSKLKGLEQQIAGPKRLSLDLWKCTGGDYPDVYIELNDIVLVMEVKKDSKPDMQQIIDQYTNTRNWLDKNSNRRRLIYFLLTNDYMQPPAVADAQNKLQRSFPKAQIHWIRWPQVWKWLKDIFESQTIGGIGKRLLDTTIELMEAENMSGPTGFKKEWFDESVTKSLDKVQKLCQEISNTVREAIKEVEDKGIEFLGDTLSSGKSKDRLYSPDEWIPHYFEFYFRDKAWNKVEKGDNDPCIYITFWLEPNKPGAEVGMWWSSPDEDDKEAIIEEVREKAEKEGLRIDEPYLADDGGLAVFRRLSPEDLENDKNIVGTLQKSLERTRDFTEDIETLQKYLRYKKKNQTKRKK